MLPVNYNDLQAQTCISHQPSVIVYLRTSDFIRNRKTGWIVHTRLINEYDGARWQLSGISTVLGGANYLYCIVELTFRAVF